MYQKGNNLKIERKGGALKMDKTRKLRKWTNRKSLEMDKKGNIENEQNLGIMKMGKNVFGCWAFCVCVSWCVRVCVVVCHVVSYIENTFQP